MSDAEVIIRLALCVRGDISLEDFEDWFFDEIEEPGLDRGLLNRVVAHAMCEPGTSERIVERFREIIGRLVYQESNTQTTSLCLDWTTL